jgi:hypothetical protein
MARYLILIQDDAACAALGLRAHTGALLHHGVDP